MANRQGGKPNRKAVNSLATPLAPEDNNTATPVFCLGFIQPSCDVKRLPESQQADFAVALQDKARFTWKELTLNRKHSHGVATLPRRAIKKQIPERFSDEDRFHVLRYTGNNRAMVGVRAGKVFHILWIEKTFGDVYDH